MLVDVGCSPPRQLVLPQRGRFHRAHPRPRDPPLAGPTAPPSPEAATHPFASRSRTGHHARPRHGPFTHPSRVRARPRGGVPVAPQAAGVGDARGAMPARHRAPGRQGALAAAHLAGPAADPARGHAARPPAARQRLAPHRRAHRRRSPGRGCIAGAMDSPPAPQTSAPAAAPTGIGSSGTSTSSGCATPRRRFPGDAARAQPPATAPQPLRSPGRRSGARGTRC